ncbi:hypothetical protein HK103_003508 [Boothiomyces macroporosus]|uniref:Uncharacterized protein n=1 Tax=Boothiomyces macroporosus TaxID=261099 RepID=A0AAD5UK85_9FUNG|nr:hypothetical protein HK103_003508 [Boothiomyces macroporosus]
MNNPDVLINGTIDGDPPMTDSSFYDATILLVAPFVLIPVGIIAARLTKYIWKIYEAKKYGFGDDLFQDPLAELGLKVKRGYDNTHDIRKIRKEQQRMEKLVAKRRESEAARNKENERILGQGTEPKARINFIELTQLHAAENYIADIRQKTKKTWYEKFSPQAVRRWFQVSRVASFWMAIQVLTTALAIVNYVALTYLAVKDDRDERNLIKNLDLFYATLFLMDYCLSFYIAEDRLRFYFNTMSLIDLASIVSPFVYLFIASPTKYVWFIGFIRIFRATRILRTYRLLSFAQSEETRELTLFTLNFLNFIFFSASIINATEALDFEVAPPSLKNWHDSLYYIMVTFSTIGFGDLTPSSTISRIVVMFLIILVIIYVPWQTGKIIEVFNSYNKYQRSQHTPDVEVPHVILGGTVTYSSVIDFCREFFVADEVATIVILHDDEPSLEFVRFMNHPFYRNRIVYLQGSLMSIQDLRRAQAPYASAMYLLNSSPASKSEEEDTSNVSEFDTKTLMNALYAKNAFPGLPIFAQINDYKSLDISSHCGIDRSLPIDEIKASLFASTCISPGIQTLVLNLVHSYKDIAPENMNEFWTHEYQCGVANQIQSFRIPSGLVGIKFKEVAEELFTSFNCMIFALVAVNSGFNQNQIRFKIEKDYKLKHDDIAFCIADGGDEMMLRIALHYKEYIKKEDLAQKELEIEMSKVVKMAASEAVVESPFISSPDVLGTFPTSAFGEVELGKIPEGLADHIIITGYIPSRIVLLFVQFLRVGNQGSKEVQDKTSLNSNSPIVCLLEELPEMNEIWTEILSFHSVYVIKGRAIEKLSLTRAKIEKCKKLVIFGKKSEQGEHNSAVTDAQSVFLVKLLQKEWPQVKFLVELIDGSNVKYLSSRKMEWDTNNLRIQSVLNNYAMSVGDRQTIYRNLRSEGLEKTMIAYQLFQFFTGFLTEKDGKSNAIRPPAQKREMKKEGDYEAIDNLVDTNEIEQEAKGKKEITLTEAYLNKALEEKELQDSGFSPYPVYHFDRHFAAGMVTSSSFVQAILCQCYFRPYIIDIFRGLIKNVSLLPVKESLVGQKYLTLVQKCLNSGYIPLGIYRNGALPFKGAFDAESLPYVYTNCRPGEIVTKNDLIFILKMQ